MGVSFDEYVRKRKNEEAKNNKVSSSSGTSFEDYVFKNKVVDQMDASSVSNWLKEADSVFKSSKEYFDNNRYTFDKEYGKQFEKQFNDLSSSYEAVKSYVNRNKGSFEDYKSLMDTISAYNDYIQDGRKISKSKQDLFSGYGDEWDFHRDIMTKTGDNTDKDSIDARNRSYTAVTGKIAEIDNKLNNWEYKNVWQLTAGLDGITHREMVRVPKNQQEYDALVSEKDRLQAYATQYERGVKDTDELYTQYFANADWAVDSKNRDFNRPTWDDTNKYKAIDPITNERYNIDASSIELEDPLGTYLAVYNGEEGYDTLYREYTKYDEEAVDYLNAYDENLRQGRDGHWELLKDNEIDLYYYMLSNDLKEEAMSYLKGMEIELDRRSMVEYQEELKKAKALGLIFHNAASIPANIVGGATAFIHDTIDAVAGNEINPYEGGHSLQNYAQSVRGETAGRIDTATGASENDWLTWGDAYQGLMSGADSAVGALTLGKAYPVIMGMGAASSEAKELYERGASKEQIVAGSLLAGATEMLFEKFSVGYFLDDVLGKPAKNIGQWAVKTLGMAGVEATEELGTTIGNYIADATVRGGASDWAEIIRKYTNEGYSDGQAVWKAIKEVGGEALHDAAIGAISGGGMGVVGNTGNAIRYNSAAKAEGNSIINRGGVESLVALANEMSGVNDIDLSKQVRNVNGKKGINAKAVGGLSFAVNDARSQINKADIVKALEDKGVDSKKAQKYADILVSMNDKYFAGKRDSIDLGTASEWKKITGDENAYAVLYDVVKNANSSVNARNQRYDLARKGLKLDADGKVTLSDERVKKIEDAVLKPTYDKKSEDITATVSKDGKTKVDGNEVAINGIDRIVTEDVKGEDGKITKKKVAYLNVTDANGNESVVNLDSVEFGSRQEAVLYDTFVGSDIDPAHFDAFVNNFNEEDFNGDLGEAAIQYALGFQNAYRYGWANMENELGDNVYASKLTESARNIAYTLGKETVSKQTEAKQKALDAAVAERKASGKGKARTKGKLHMDATVKATITNGELTGMRKAGVELAKRLTSIGLDVYLYESHEDDNGNWVDENGKEAENGFYVGKSGEIHIDLNAGVSGNGIMVYTLAHEVTHFIRDFNPREFKILADFVIEHYGKKGMSVAEQITEIMVNENVSWDTAYEELVAKSCESFFTDSNIVERIIELKQKDKRTWERLRDKVLDFIKWMRSVMSGHDPESKQGKLFHQWKGEIDHIYDAFTNALSGAIDTYQAVGSIAEAKTNAETLATAGITVDADTGSAVMNSVRYAPKTQAEIDKVAKALSESLGVSIEKAKSWVKSETSLASIVLDPSNALFLDYEADDRYEAIKKNADYPQGTVDFSNLCKKRREFTALLDKLQKEHPNRIITAAEMEQIRQILIDENVEVACGLCYVEERRQLLGEIAQGFIDGYKNGTLKESIAKELDAKDNYVPTIYDLITYDGYRALTTEHPAVAKAFQKFNNARGMQAGRLIEGIAEYKRDILKWSQERVDFVNSVGGLRVFSFSDFEATHLIDLVQVVQDCAAKGVMIQAYTKVPSFANAVKDTNMKVNRSLIAKGTGIKYENGRKVLDLDPVEGIDINDKDFFDSSNSKSVGNVLVGMSDEQIRLAMKTPFVDYIIPFHTSLKSEILVAKKIDHWDNYKNFQTDKEFRPEKVTYKKDGSVKKDGWVVAENQINVYVDVIQAAEAEGKPIKNKLDFVNKFLAVAKEKGLKPRFWQFLDVDANGDYVYTEGYHKFLVDFKLFDQDGNILPQEPVVPVFDDALNARILKEYVAGKKAPVSRDAVYDRLEREVINGEVVKNSARRDYSYNALVSKKDMPIAIIRGNVPTNRADIVAIAKRNAAKVGKTNKDGSVSVRVNDIDTDVVLTTHGLRHGLRRKEQLIKANGIVTPMAGEIIQNSILVNELIPADDNASSAYVLMGIAQDTNGYLYIVRSVVNRFDKELVSMDTLYAVNAKKELAVQNAPRLAEDPLSVTSPTISVADFLDYVNQYFPNVLSEDVLRRFGHTERPKEINSSKRGKNKDLGEDILFSRRASNSELASMDSTALYINNTKKANYIGMILNGTKTEETRSQRTLDKFIGKKVFVTDKDKVYGWVVLGEPHKYTEEEFRKTENQKKHRVPKGDEYDVKPGGSKWAYPIESYERFDSPKKLSESKDFAYSHQAREVKYSKRQKAPTFYSYMGVVVDGVKQDKLGAASVINLLKGKGVKDEEIKWSGIETWLEGKKSVTRAELQEFIAGSQLQIGEQVGMTDIGESSSEYLSDAANTIFFAVEREFPYSLDFSEISSIIEDTAYNLEQDRVDLTYVRDSIEGYVMEAVENHFEPTDEYYDVGEWFDSEDGQRIYDAIEEAVKTIGVYAGVIPNKQGYRKTRWHDYALDGGENYREIVFTMPNSTYSNQAMRAHWGVDAEGIIAHARIQDFVDADGNKMLFVEEIQSDWHNEGHKVGYRNVNEDGRATAAYAVPDAPFRKTYQEFVIKRLIRMAAEEGYDSIGWTTAQIQSDRWSDRYAEGYSIEYDKEIPKFLRKYGNKWGATVGKTSLGVTGRAKFVTSSGREFSSFVDAVNAVVEEANETMSEIGYEYKVSDVTTKEDGNEITVLDNIGLVLGTITKSTSTEVWSMPITDSMKDSVLYEGQVMYQRRGNSTSNRSLLANALEGVAQNDIEARRLAEYREKIDLINAEERKLRETRAKIAELSFAKGKRDTAKIKSLQETATRIANRINTYDKQLLRLEATAPLMAVLEREKAALRKREKQRMAEAVAKYREKSAETLREVMQRNTESRKRASEGRHKTEMRHKIKSVVSELNQLLLHGTREKHVKIDLQKATAEALSAINMDTVNAEKRLEEIQRQINATSDPDKIAKLQATYDRIEQQGENMKNKLTALKSAYEDIKDSNDPLVAGAYHPEIEERIKNLRKNVWDTPLREMTLEQLEDVYDTYRMVLHTIRTANKAFKADKAESISELANRTMDEIHIVGGTKKYRSVIGDFFKKFFWNGLKPVYAFKAIGSGTLSNMFDSVRDGEDTWAVDVSEAKDFYKNVSKKHNYDSWDFNKQYAFKSKTGQEFSLSIEQIMSLYAYSKRKQADEHLEKGGFVFDEAIEVTEKKHGIPVKYGVNVATSHNLSRETIGEIVATLSDEQKAFVDEMQAYLSDVMGAKGNEVSLEMFGVKLFKEKFYFPLKSANQFMYEQNEVAGEVRLKNSGFSKETVAHANNPIILSNFMDVWASHVNDMSMYHAFVLPLEDFNRVFNYKTPSTDNLDTESVKMYLQNAYGSHPIQYIKQLLTDLNGGARTDPSADFITKMTGLFKKSAVFASASVVIQQPSAIARAASMIDNKYFATKLSLTQHKAEWAEVKKYAPVAIIKEMGYFDTHMGRSTTDFIKAKEYDGVAEKMKGLFTDSGYRDEVLSKAPAVADELAWCYIWNAVKKEVADTTDLSKGSEEFLKKCGERFTEVVVNTQVYDSVLSRSAMMRSKDTGMKMAAAFMAEPTTSINMIADAIIQGKRGNKKGAAKTVGAVVASLILNSILVSFVYAGRDDDEDKTYAEKYIGTLTGELIDSFNPLTMIPFVKDIISIAQGYDVERSDMAVITDLFTAIKKLSNDKISAYRKVEDFGGAIASIFGLPVKNIMRDVRAMYNTIYSFVSGEDTTGAGIGHAVEETVTGKEVSDANQLYNAIISGDKSHESRVKSRLKSESKVESALREGLRENDPRIHEAAKARYDGDVDEYMRIAREIKAEGHFSQDTIVRAINAEINKLKPDEESEPSSPSFVTAADYYVAIVRGETVTAEAIKDELIAQKVAEGSTTAEAEDSVASGFVNQVKSEYIDGAVEKEEAIDLVDTYGGDAVGKTKVKEWDFEIEVGYSWGQRDNAYRLGVISKNELISYIMDIEGEKREDAVNKVRVFDFRSDYPEYSDVSSESIEKFYKPIENGSYDLGYSLEETGMDIDVYAEYVRLASECKGVDRNKDGKADSGTVKAEKLKAINSLPLTRKQKDALYYLNGWTKKDLYKAPWH